MKIRNFLKKIRKDEDGATMIEYAIIASLISVVAIAAITTTGTRINTTFENVRDSLPTGAR